MKCLLAAALLMGLAACADDAATSAQPAAQAAAPPPPVNCERVAPTGSNVSVTRCTHPATASDHMDARDAVRTLAGPGAPAAGPNGH